MRNLANSSALRAGFLIVFLFFSSESVAAILWGPAAKKNSRSRFNYDHTDEAKTVASFWSQNKMAVGVSTAGAYGLIGGVVGIHFHPQWSVELGYGGGSHFQSFGFRVKKLMLLSSPLNPYFATGFHRWERNTTRPFDANDVSPGFVVGDFMSAADKIQGRIDEKLIHGALGVQYTFMKGDWQGYGFFLEALVLMSVEDFQTAPTASFGINYFF